MTNPRNAQTTSRGRTYLWRDETFDSVTTIIGGGVPKPALKAWGERTVAEFAFDNVLTWQNMERGEAVDWMKRAPFRATDKAAVQGSDIHDWAEQYVLGTAMPLENLPLLQRPYAQGFLQFLEDWQPSYEMTEATVYSRTYGYAGTCDSLMVIEGERWLIDYKSGKGVYGEVALQLSAYRHAEFVGLPDGSEVPMPEIDQCGVLHLTPKGYLLIPVRADTESFEFFLFAQQVRIFCEAVSREVLGAPLVKAEVTA